VLLPCCFAAKTPPSPFEATMQQSRRASRSLQERPSSQRHHQDRSPMRSTSTSLATSSPGGHCWARRARLARDESVPATPAFLAARSGRSSSRSSSRPLCGFLRRAGEPRTRSATPPFGDFPELGLDEGLALGVAEAAGGRGMASSARRVRKRRVVKAEPSSGPSVSSRGSIACTTAARSMPAACELEPPPFGLEVDAGAVHACGCWREW
jgi:hypothetical protein